MAPSNQGISCLDFGELSRVATFVWSLRDKASSKRDSETGSHALGIVVIAG
jgi:hypothetical protein